MRDNNTPRAERHASRPQSAARRAASSAQSFRSGRTGYDAHAVRKQPARKARRRRPAIQSENLRTALWLWCPPVGLTKMWRSTCTWRRGVKIGITVAMAAILLAIFIIPTPQTAKYETGVQMVASKPEVEVYGPALPALIVPGYTKESNGSIIVDEVASDVHYVYAADGADCYHEYECKFAFASSQRLTVYEAYHLGFKPCGRCNPPVYIPGETDPITAQPLGVTNVTAAADTTAEGDAAAVADTTAEVDTAVEETAETTVENPA